MKKVLIFSLSYYPFVGGAEIAIKEITDRIKPENISFDMITLRFDSTLPKVEKIGHVTVHRIGFSKNSPTTEELRKFPLHLNKFYFQFFAALKGFQLHKRNTYDGIWAVMAHSAGIPAGIFKTVHKDVSYALTLQEGDPPKYIERLALPVWPFFVRGFRLADFLIGESTFLERWGRKLGFQGPSEVIPNAVDTKYFSKEYSESELNEIKQKLEKKEDDIYLITTSRLVKKNAVDDVIKSLKHLPDKVKFLVLGIGPDKEMLKNLAKNEGVAERVMFLGFIDNREIPKYLKISNIFIRPSLSEGMGNSFIEAMAAGIPVIATQEGGIADFLFDPDRNPNKKPTGRAVDTRDFKGIASAVKLYLDNKEKTQEIVNNAQKMVFEKYDWNLIAKDMKEKVFDKMFL